MPELRGRRGTIEHLLALSRVERFGSELSDAAAAPRQRVRCSERYRVRLWAMLWRSIIGLEHGVQRRHMAIGPHMYRRVHQLDVSLKRAQDANQFGSRFGHQRTPPKEDHVSSARTGL